MAPNRHTQLANLLLGLLPADHTTVGNITLLAQFLAAAHTHGTQSPAFALQAQATPVPLFIADAYRTVAVKIVDDRGIESLKLMKLEGAH